MDDIKLLAVRPLTECHNDFLKVLEPDKFYAFYSNYSFDEVITDGKRKVTISFTEGGVSSKLYAIQRHGGALPVNISAVVGKNGTGKSTLLELFFALVYLLSVDHDILESVDQEAYRKVKRKLRAEVYYSIGESIYCIRYNGDDQVKGQNGLQILAGSPPQRMRNFKISQLLDVPIDIETHIFYSIAVNYSIYGLNSLYIGSWINALFHKNDGYQTPLVINPMRSRGTFNINEENYFAKTRLLSNLLVPYQEGNDEHLFLTDKQKATSLVFTVNPGKVKYALVKNPNATIKETLTFEQFYEINPKAELLAAVYEILFGIPDHQDGITFGHVMFYELVERYIVKKLIKISRTYKEYRQYFNEFAPKGDDKQIRGELQYAFNNVREYLRDLADDNTHITFKLRQAVNYLKNDLLREDQDHFWIEKSGKDESKNRSIRFTIPIEKLSDRIQRVISPGEMVVRYIPPSLFNVDIILEGKDANGLKNSKFKDLSSGEQQLVHSIQSVLYHLINVNSVFGQAAKPGRKAKPRQPYQYVNIILDEVELYFHPDLQRRFVRELLKSIGRIEIPKILGINILFSTHSPFILSDILETNVLFLTAAEDQEEVEDSMEVDDEGQATGIKTFGANLYDLLAEGFFLRKGVIGAFAQHKIQEVILDLNLQDITTPNTGLSKVELKQLIDLIGEQFLREKLEDMYYEKFEDELEKKDEIMQLRKRLRELEG